MERYCVGDIYRKKDFQSPDAGEYFDINYNRLMKELMLQTKQETWNLPAGPLSIKNKDLLYPEKVFGSIQEEYSWADLFERISLSVGCEMDILNDLYLILLAADDSEEPLFVDSPLNVTIKTKKMEVSSIDQMEDLNQKMKNTIHNKHKKDASLDDLIFNIETLRESRKTKIHPLGRGVKRLWLYSKKFRKLFIKPEKNFGKYEMKEMQHILGDNGHGYIEYGIDDCIILEKLLGIDTRLHFHLYILLQLKELEYNVFEPLIDTLMECEGLYSRRLFIQDLGYRLSKKESQTRGVKIQWIEAYTEELKKAIELFNGSYHKAIRIYMENYTKMYSYEKAKEMIINKRNLLSSFTHPFISQSSDYEKNIKKELYEYIVELIFQQKNRKDEAVKILEKWDNIRNRMYLWSENEFYYKGNFYEELESEKLANIIQSRIIEKNFQKYNSKMDIKGTR